MVKKARPKNPARIKELRVKIMTDVYLQLAISRLALMITKELMGL